MGRRFVHAPSLAMVVALAVLVPGASLASAAGPDRLNPLLNRMKTFFRHEEIDGITQDARYALNPTEVVRLSIVSQLLACNDLYAVHHGSVQLEDVRARAEFLLLHLQQVRSGSPFDGMLAYAMLGASEITGDPRYFAAGERLVRDVMRFSGFSSTLNWGLMAAMGTAKYYEMTGDPAAYAKTQQIVASLPQYQHADGSFPHYCPGSVDIHYTAWMGMELIHIRRSVPSPLLDQILARIAGFLATRVGPGGGTLYQDACGNGPCRYYYSIATGCWFDYDTRAWINELGYTALVLDAFAADRGDDSPLGLVPEAPALDPYAEVIGFLDDLEDHGAVQDKWGFIPPPGDPYYVWATGNPSVIRTSVVFWSLATEYRERRRREGADDDRPRPPALAGSMVRVREDDPPGVPGAPDWPDDQPWRRFVWSTVDRLVLEGADPDVVCGASGDPEEMIRRPRSRELAREVEGRGVASPAGLPARIRRVVEEPGRLAIHFTLPRDSRVALVIYDLAGRRVRALDSGFRAAGEYQVAWDGRDGEGVVRSAGVYFVRLRAEPGGESSARILLRR